MSNASLLGFAKSETYKVDIVNPATGLPFKDKNGKTWFWEVFAKSSEKGQAWVRGETNRQLKLGNRYKPTAENLIETNDRFYASMVKSWFMSNLATGEEIPFSEEKAFEFLQDADCDFIRKPVAAAVDDDSNFFQASLKK